MQDIVGPVHQKLYIQGVGPPLSQPREQLRFREAVMVMSKGEFAITFNKVSLAVTGRAAKAEVIDRHYGLPSEFSAGLNAP